MTSKMIPFANPHAKYMLESKSIQLAVKRVFDSGYYVLGPEVSQFEQEFSDYIGSKYCVGVGSGSDALLLSLRALDICEGDEVITVSHTAVATVSAISMVGAKPVLVDIDPESKNIDPSLINKAITDNTKAIIVVHLYGQPANMDSIFQNIDSKKITIIEDCAQATGAIYKNKKVGSIGHIGCFSFYPTKNLGGIGDGGAITTNDKYLYERIERLRQYGWDKNRESKEISLVSRLDEIQAAILRTKLKSLDNDNKKRQSIANIYLEELKDTPIQLPKIFTDASCIYHLFVIVLEQRNELKKHLESNNIGTGIHYPKPVHLQPAFDKKIKIDNKLPVTEEICKKILSLPMFPELENKDVLNITKTIKRFFHE